MSRKIFIGLVLVFVVVLAGGGYFYYQSAQAAPEQTEETTLQTTTVRRGSLVISASGTGSVISKSELSIGFEQSGKIAEMLVEVGDEVKTGDVLARLESNESDATLVAQVTAAELTVLKAEQSLESAKTPADALTIAQAKADLANAQKSLNALLSPSESDLAAAELAVVEAQDTVDDAQTAVDRLQYNRGSQQTVEAARAAYLLAQDKVDRMQQIYESTPGSSETDAGKALALSNLAAAKTERDRALATLNWYLGEPTDTEVAEKNTTLIVAQGVLAEAQEYLETLKNPSVTDIELAEAKVAALEDELATLEAGPDPDDILIAETELANAQAQLALKQEALATQELIAPMDGTVMSVSAVVGDNVSTTPIITLANLEDPMLEVFVDETDINNIGVGYEVEVVFDALPEQTFTGHVISVDPSLVSSGMVQAVRATVQIDPESFTKPQRLPVGLNASVEVIGSQAENVLLVPVEALRELSEGKYGIFVVENDEPKLRIVEVGLMDLTYAEIITGLDEGDVVTTGVVETSQ